MYITVCVKSTCGCGIALLLVSSALSNPVILSTERNEGAFSIKEVKGKVCVVGRMDNGRDYDALIGVVGGKFFRISSKGDDYSYTAESYGGSCLGGITTLGRGKMDMALVAFGKGRPEVLKIFSGEGNDMLWFIRKVSEGFLLVGGVKKEDWDILVVKLGKDLKVEWSLRIGTRGHEYAYGAVEHGGVYYVVGRSNFRGSWDGFIIELLPNGRLRRSLLVGSDRKDYFRFVGVFRDKILAVGRSEARNDSDIWVYSEGGSFLYDGGEFDYGRAFVPWKVGIALVGDTYRDGQSDGVLLILNEDFEVVKGYGIGGEDVESVRFITEEGWFAGYSYSFSLDNDLFLGRVEDICPQAVRSKTFKRLEGPAEVHDYPVTLYPYPLKEVDQELEVEEVELKKIDPCSGIDEGFDLSD